MILTSRCASCARIYCRYNKNALVRLQARADSCSRGTETWMRRLLTQVVQVVPVVTSPLSPLQSSAPRAIYDLLNENHPSIRHPNVHQMSIVVSIRPPSDHMPLLLLFLRLCMGMNSTRLQGVLVTPICRSVESPPRLQSYNGRGAGVHRSPAKGQPSASLWLCSAGARKCSGDVPISDHGGFTNVLRKNRVWFVGSTSFHCNETRPA